MINYALRSLIPNIKKSKPIRATIQTIPPLRNSNAATPIPHSPVKETYTATIINTNPTSISAHLFILSFISYLFVFKKILFFQYRNAYVFKIGFLQIIMREIKPIKIEKDMKVSELVDGMGSMGFGAGKISKASSIMKRMFQDEDCKVFFGLAGAMVPAGMRKVVTDLLDEIDVFVTTGANLTHDLIESLGEKHYLGDEFVSDSKLNEEGIDRIYNVFMKNEVYVKLENFFKENFNELKDCESIKEFLWKLGELAPGESILKKCFDKKIPIFCPGIADSGIGLMIWGRIIEEKQKTDIDVFSDINDIIDISWASKKTGIIYVGGGLPKNFIQQSLQFSKGADYGIQITTDRAESGGSSGAPLKEGISWGKMKKNADFVDVFCDATIALPLIYGAIKNNC
ncbi:deoxyhypusine synthase [Candidatus Pacearchaeota archaeon]|nr:MAG: deoxyhypusine synthase [Candidatus Pacearchaeota archaeon]